jgi:alpha-beta hydrolase superfamily lysophospholipase
VGAEHAQFLPWVSAAYRLCYHVFAYDQRDHGASSGATTSLGEVEALDAALAYDEAVRRPGTCPRPRVLWGVSLGGAAAQAAAPRLRGVDGVVVDSTFAELTDVARRALPLGPLAPLAAEAARPAAWLLTGRDALGFEPWRAAAEPVAYPVLVLHARGDPLVPFAHAEWLARAYGDRATLVPFDGRGHPSTRPSDRERYDRAVDDFLRRLEESPLPPVPRRTRAAGAGSFAPNAGGRGRVFRAERGTPRWAVSPGFYDGRAPENARGDLHRDDAGGSAKRAKERPATLTSRAPFAKPSLSPLALRSPSASRARCVGPGGRRREVLP